jgi:hypothetical protein
MKFTAVRITASHFCHRQLRFVTMKPQISGPTVLPPAIEFLEFGQRRELACIPKCLHIDSHFSPSFMQKVQILGIVSVSAFLTDTRFFSNVPNTGFLAQCG